MATIEITDTLILDQSSGVQDHDTAVSNDLTGLSTAFQAFLNGLAGDLARLTMPTTSRLRSAPQALSPSARTSYGDRRFIGGAMRLEGRISVCARMHADR